MAEPQRIAKLLARAGVASRREIERMIADGRVALDGVALTTPATILTGLKGVTVDGKPVAAPEAARLFLYHKTPGLLTAERDARGRTTIYDRLPADLPRVMPVGRLDLNTEGLLLLTTDGGLKRTLELPATGLPRTYRARAHGTVSQAQLEELIDGITIDGVRYGAIDANLERRTGTNQWIEMTIKEGKNREVRRILEHLGLDVNRLIRTAYGPFALGDLMPGAVVEVKQHVVVDFMKTLAKFAAPSRPDPAFAGQALRKVWRITPKGTGARAVDIEPAARPGRNPRETTAPRPATAGDARAARGASPARGGRPMRAGDDRAARPAKAATAVRRAPPKRGEDITHATPDPRAARRAGNPHATRAGSRDDMPADRRAARSAARAARHQADGQARTAPVRSPGGKGPSRPSGAKPGTRSGPPPRGGKPGRPPRSR